jgi:hypothetical protein
MTREAGDLVYRSRSVLPRLVDNYEFPAVPFQGKFRRHLEFQSPGSEWRRLGDRLNLHIDIPDAISLGNTIGCWYKMGCIFRQLMPRVCFLSCLKAVDLALGHHAFPRIVDSFGYRYYGH